MQALNSIEEIQPILSCEGAKDARDSGMLLIETVADQFVDELLRCDYHAKAKAAEQSSHLHTSLAFAARC